MPASDPIEFYEDHLLTQTLSCQSYDDTTTSFDILFDEVRNNPEFMEQGGPEASGAVRTFITKWQDRHDFIENMIGFAKVNPDGTDGIVADASTGFNGKHIHRKLPVGYDMGYYDSSGNQKTLVWYDPVTGTSCTSSVPGWVFPIRYQVYPHGPKKTNRFPNSEATYGPYVPTAIYARIVFTYASLEYDLLSDSHASIYSIGSGSGKVTTMQEWNRFARIVQKPASIFFKPPGVYLKLVNHPFMTKEYPEVVNKLDNIADFWVYLYDLPYDPIVGINKCFGMVNKYSIFATPDFPTGQPAETLHFISADIQRLPLRMGKRYWNAILGFRKVFNRDLSEGSGSGAGSNVYGHNHIRYFDSENLPKQLHFYRLSADGTTSLAAGNPFIDVEDFGKIFWIS